MSIVNSFKQESTLKLNDIIEEYKYVYKGQEVKAGDFLVYADGINGTINIPNTNCAKKLSSHVMPTSTTEGKVIAGVEIDPETILVLYSGASTTFPIMGRIIKLTSEGTVLGEAISICSSERSGYSIAVTLIDKNKVFIAHRVGAGTNYLYGTVCTIEGTTITAGTTTKLTTTTDSGEQIEVGTLEDNKVFILHQADESSLYVSAVICTVTDTTITAGTRSTINTEYTSGQNISLAIINEITAFVTYQQDNDYYKMVGKVCRVRGTTVSYGYEDPYVLGNYNNSAFGASCVTLNENQVFIASHKNSNYCMGKIITLSGTAITTIGTELQLGGASSSSSYSQHIYTSSSILLSNGNIFVMYAANGGGELAGAVVKPQGSTLSLISNEINLATTTGASGYGGTKAAAPLSFDNILILYAYSDAPYSILWNVSQEGEILPEVAMYNHEDFVLPAIEPPFDAIALEQGEGASEYIEGIVENKVEGNIFPSGADENWTELTTQTSYQATDGTIVTCTESSNTTFNAYDVFDGGSYYPFLSGNSHVVVELPEPKKITKMSARMKSLSTNQNVTIVQGSKDGIMWIDLWSVVVPDTETTYEMILANIDYYKFYKIEYQVVPLAPLQLSRWKVLEYIEPITQQVPNTSLIPKDKIKIAKVYEETEIRGLIQGDIIPKTWTQVSTSEYTADNGIILKASSVNTLSGTSYAYYACDGNDTTGWKGKSGDYTSSSIRIYFPEGVKITKMKIKASNGMGWQNMAINGWKTDGTTTELYKSTVEPTALTEIALINLDYYNYYQIVFTFEGATSTLLYEWETSEYEGIISKT